MRWLERQPELTLPSAQQIAMLRQAIAARPENPALYARLGLALSSARQPAEAIAAFDRARTLDPKEFNDWAALAQAHLDHGDAEAALAISEQGAASAALRYQRGLALQKLDRPQDAATAFRAAADLGSVTALARLLQSLATEPDGGALLDLCDSVPDTGKNAVLIRAYRAIAFSRLGRDEEARALVDLERHVARVPFEPPSEFGGIEAFNRLLARETLADPSPAPVSREGFEINYTPRFDRSPAFQALRSFMCSAIETYLAEMPARGLDKVLPPPPAAGLLGGSTVVLRGPAHNGQHIHTDGYVSAVYYVQVPQSVRDADDTRGALALGCCDGHTGGYAPGWGTRFLKPVPGTLVLIPSYLFHDVVPSGTDEPRISIAADLKPRG